jgi:heme/copper-type cytochrome/quinol oxidase subunit 2
MNKERKKIDELIKGSLNEDEAKLFDELGEHNLIGKLGEVYRGRMGWLAILMNVVHLVIFGVLIYCIVQFFGTQETHELITWASAGFMCMIIMAMLKLYIWMQMDKNDMLRELRRLQLQVATLSSKQDI